MGWQEEGQRAEPVGLVLATDLSCGWKTRGDEGVPPPFFHLAIMALPSINGLISDRLSFPELPIPTFFNMLKQ